MLEPAGERRIPLTSLAEVAGDAGLEAGFPWTKHAPATPFEPDAPLAVDASAASALAAWFATGQQALAALVAELADEDPSAPAGPLWGCNAAPPRVTHALDESHRAS